MEYIVSMIIIGIALKSKCLAFQILAMGIVAIIFFIKLVYLIYKFRKEE